MRTYLLFVTFVIACDGGGTGAESAAVTGSAVYRDATTDHAGTERAPAAPPAQAATISVVLRGSGTIPEPDPQCLRDPLGQFEARYAGTVDIDDGGAYVATLGEGTIATPSGCAIPELSAGVVTDVVVRAELQATTQNCEAYCAASARADAEASCGASASAAACRAAAETDAAAACTTTCTTQRTKIVAEATLGAGSIGDVDATSLRTATFADLEARLVFDVLE